MNYFCMHAAIQRENITNHIEIYEENEVRSMLQTTIDRKAKLNNHTIKVQNRVYLY